MAGAIKEIINKKNRGGFGLTEMPHQAIEYFFKLISPWIRNFFF
jgi:hypothetical protein